MTKKVALLLTFFVLLSAASCDADGKNDEPSSQKENTVSDSTASESETVKETVMLPETVVVETDKATDTDSVTEKDTSVTNDITEDITETNTEIGTGGESDTDEATTEEEKMIIENIDDFKVILQEAVVFKFGSPFALINGERVSTDGVSPLFTKNALFPVDFIEKNKLGKIDERYIVESDGIRYITGNTFLLDGKQVYFISDESYVIITEDNWDIAESSDLRDKIEHEVNNLYSLGTTFNAKMTGERPVLFVTDEMLADAIDKAMSFEEPWFSAWQDIKQRADSVLGIGARPDTGASATAYRLAACKDLINARYLALAYLYTEEVKYLDGAVSILMAYAEPMLGTDKYLDYSAATTDGQADIGLNIAAPLTTACDVYAMLYTHIDADDKVCIENWIRAEADLCVKGHKYWIKNNYYGKQYGNNHLTSHLMGIISAAYVLEDNSLLEYALYSTSNEADLIEMLNHAILIEGDEVYSADPDSDYVSGEIYDRYRVVQNNGFGYAMYHLKFLTHSALMLYHNGIDVFNYCGERGENILLSYHAYADYLINNDITYGVGHYSNDKSLNRESAFSIYSIAYYIYKDETVKNTIEAMKMQNVICNEIEAFGITTPFLFGIPE